MPDDDELLLRPEVEVETLVDVEPPRCVEVVPPRCVDTDVETPVPRELDELLPDEPPWRKLLPLDEPLVVVVLFVLDELPPMVDTPPLNDELLFDVLPVDKPDDDEPPTVMFELLYELLLFTPVDTVPPLFGRVMIVDEP